MIITISFTDSSFILLLFLILSLSAIENCKASIDALKPCFERYVGQRLSNLSPYHSEWRMKTPEECLLFCALSSSRCRSTVHDTFQHICYYFLDDGQQHTRIARGMIYFRVVEKKCLDQFLNGFNTTLLSSSSSIPISDTSRGFIEPQRPAVAHANPLIHVPPGGRAITPTPYFDYFDNQQKLKKHEKFDESNLTVATSTITTSDNTAISAGSIIVSTLTSPPTIFSKVLEKEDEIYDEVISFSEFSASTFPTFLSRQDENSTNSTSREPKILEQSSHETYPSDDASFFIGNIRNLPVLGTNFGKDRQKDGVDLNKVLKAIPEDVRRSPIKISLTDAENLNENTSEIIPLSNAEKSIVNKLISIPTVNSISLTLSKQNGRIKKLLSSAVCGNNEREVWLVIENAALKIDQIQTKTNVGSYKSCKAKCNIITNSGRECTSFTYDEVKRHCMIHFNNDDIVSSLTFLSSPKSNFNIRTAVKFCYPENLIVFEECSEFIAFLDYMMYIKPREIFNDIPKGHQGLHACIELCVLTSHFHCKSAAFAITLGKCLLYDEDSLSSPDLTEARMERIPIKRPSDIRQEQLQQISGVYYVEN